MTTTAITNQMREMAISYYTDISSNKVISACKGRKFPDSIALKVQNPTFGTIGTIWIIFKFKYRTMYVASEIGIHASREF